jgi:hypothetical protein
LFEGFLRPGGFGGHGAESYEVGVSI